MKNYEEMAKDVLHRIGEYEEEKKSRRSRRAVAAGAAVSLCTVAVIGTGLWKSGAFAPEKEAFSNTTDAAVEPVTEEAYLQTTEAEGQQENAINATALTRKEFPIPEYEITDKTSCYHKLLNCVDYYNAAAGKIETNILNGYLSTIEYNVDMCEGTGYQHVLADDFDEEVFVGDGEVRTEGHIHNNSLLLPAYRKSGGERTIEDDEKRISTLDGEPCYTYRQNVTNLHYASTVSIFPQEMAFGFLGNKELWDITGRTEYLGREVVIVQGTTTPAYGQKLNVSTFTMMIDCKTGVLLKFEGYGPSGELTKYMTTTEFTDEVTSIPQYTDGDKVSEVQAVSGNDYTETGTPNGTVTMQLEGSDEPLKGRIIYAYPSYSEASYASPENGTFFLMREVQGALDEYGSDENIIYYVVLDIFSDRHHILDDPQAVYKAEADRLFALGYTSIIETYTDQNGISTTVIALHATADQLRNFVPAENYGYAIRMHDEWKPGMANEPVSFNGTGIAVPDETKDIATSQ